MASVKERVVSIEATVWERKGIEHVERGREWSIWLNGSTTLHDIEEFYEVAESIFKWCIKAHKNNNAYQVQVSQCVYYDDSTSKVDVWVSDSWYDQDGITIYMRPDERYTEPQRDWCLTKNIRKDLASRMV